MSILRVDGIDARNNILHKMHLWIIYLYKKIITKPRQYVILEGKEL